jgi:hypothetical protein
MPNERRVYTGNPDPHFDGRREGPISDPDGGPKMGIRSDIDPDHPLENNPSHLSNTKNKDMEELNQLINGKKVDTGERNN